MNRKFKLFALIAAIVFMLVFMGTTVTAYDVVQPDGSFCLDKVGVISDSTKTYITERNMNLEQNCKGAQMCVVVLDSIGFGTDIEEYAADVFSSWQIGRSGEDNGVLILMLIGDQNYWIMPGTGLENVLTTAALSTVINVYCEPSFAEQDYDTAVLKTFTRLNELICQDYGVNPEGTASGSGSFVGGNGSSGSDNGDGPGVGIGNSLYGRSCSDVHLPHYYSCNSCRSCASCSSCLFSCGYCGGCGSCTGFWSFLFILFIIYVVLQVLRGMGRGVHRVNRAPGAVYYGPRTSGPGPQPGGYASGPRTGGSTSHTSGAGRPSYNGFSGGGGSSRGGGAGRPAGGGSGSRSSGSPSGSSGGFSGGGGSSRGGGAGRK
jgi:uncharacterized protein